MVRSAKSQRQPRESQTQSRKSQRRRDKDEDEDEYEDVNLMTIDAGSSDQDIQRKSNALVRLALFTEHRRASLKRDEITKKVLGPNNARLFNHVFAEAQKILNNTFGMELVELRSKSELHASTPDEEALQKKEHGQKKKATGGGAKSYILRSLLDESLIESAAQTDENILEAEMADVDSDEDEDETGIRMYGSIISWSTIDQIGPIGILYVILTLILVNGRVISDGELRGRLKQLNLTDELNIEYTAQSVIRSVPLNQYLSSLMRQGYIDQQSVGETKKGKSVKRQRATQGDEDSSISYEWRWGSRAMSEFGERAVADIAAEFMVTAGVLPPEDDEDLNTVRAQMDRMLRGIEKAAGGNLVDIL